MIVCGALLRALHETHGLHFDIWSAHIQTGNIQLLYATAPFLGDFYDSTTLQTGQGHLIEYDLVLSCDHIVKYIVLQPQHVSELAPSLWPVIQLSDERCQSFIMHDAPAQHFANRAIAEYAVLNQLNRNQFLLYAAGLPAENWQPPCYIAPEHEKVLAQTGLQSGNYVTIHDGWDNNLILLKDHKSTKSWPDYHWQAFITQFKTRYPHIPLVQLGHRNSKPHPGVDFSMVGKTNIAETGWLLKHGLMHIDTETGLVHLAKAMGANSVCLNGPTNAAYYNYPDNVNIVSKACGNCWWTKPYWMARCVRNLPQPECMTTITPEMVMKRIKTSAFFPILSAVNQKNYKP